MANYLLYSAHGPEQMKAILIEKCDYTPEQADWAVCEASLLDYDPVTRTVIRREEESAVST